MAERITLYDVTEIVAPGHRRKIAVEAALELIRAYSVSSTALDYHLKNLNAYVDLIQAALEPQKK
ncbi:MAG TPA: hypothetical protein VHQ90_06625 [Thermoanaerobaculia bacterium]|nr:hypothetical protein [Thermoanaerobaculia bacterium]